MYKRQAYALIAALQAAEGIYTDFIGSLDGTNFGTQTTANFPTVLKQGQNGEYVKYNKLVQYGNVYKRQHIHFQIQQGKSFLLLPEELSL